MTSNIPPIIITTDDSIEAIRVDPSGNVGIGTATPGQMLTVRGDLSVDVPSSGSPISAFTLDVESFQTINNAVVSYFLQVRDIYASPPNGLTHFCIRGDGNVGIGTTAPSNPLHVTGNTGMRQNRLYMSGGDGWSSLTFNAHHNDANSNWVFPDPSRPCVTLEMDNAIGPSRFEVWTTTTGATTSWGTEPRFAINGDTGKVTVYGDLQVQGVKNFVQDHPLDPTKQIAYVSLEGDEAGTYTRGTWKLEGGKAVIDLPEHFGMVTSEDGLSIQLTPRGEWLQLYVVQLTTGQVIVQEAQGKSGQFDYLIQGVRKGYEHHEVIQERKSP